MASSARPVITVKQQHKTGDSVITVNQQHQIGDSFITVNQERETGDSVITIKQERETGDSVITVKQEHESGDVLITVKQQQHPIPTDDSLITVEVVNQVNRSYFFRVRRDEPLKQLHMRYRERVRMEDHREFRFIFGGRMIRVGDETANDVGLKDGGRIHVAFKLIGD